MVKKALFYMFFFILVVAGNSWAQIGSIPPKGPTIGGDDETLSLEEKIDVFLLQISKRRIICDKGYQSWTDDVSNIKALYLQQVVMDSVYLANHIAPSCQDKSGPSFVNHHPILECIYKDPATQSAYNDVIKDQSFYTYFLNLGSLEQHKQFLYFYQMLFSDIELKKSLGKLTPD
jgi:hypothetical protein